METLQHLLGIGLEPRHFTALQVSLRGIIVFLAAIILVRLANKRFLSKMTALDAILGFMLASMLARAINGSAPLVPSFVGGLVLVVLHRLFCRLSYHSHRFGGWVKGHDAMLIKDGKVLEQALKKHNFSYADLVEELRQHGGVRSPEEVKEAYLERSGKISVITQESP